MNSMEWRRSEYDRKLHPAYTKGSCRCYQQWSLAPGVPSVLWDYTGHRLTKIWSWSKWWWRVYPQHWQECSNSPLRVWKARVISWVSVGHYLKMVGHHFKQSAITSKRLAITGIQVTITHCTILYFIFLYLLSKFIVLFVQPFPRHFFTLKCTSSLKCYISPNSWWILLNIGLHTLLYVPLMSDR